jgi:hypothetical protein
MFANSNLMEDSLDQGILVKLRKKGLQVQGMPGLISTLYVMSSRPRPSYGLALAPKLSFSFYFI